MLANLAYDWRSRHIANFGLAIQSLYACFARPSDAGAASSGSLVEKMVRSAGRRSREGSGRQRMSYYFGCCKAGKKMVGS